MLGFHCPEQIAQMRRQAVSKPSNPSWALFLAVKAFRLESRSNLSSLQDGD